MLQFSHAAQAQGWPNEPPGSTVLLDCGFDTPTCDGQLLDPYNSAGLAASPPSANTVTVVNDPTAPFSPTSVMRASLFYPNTNGGTEMHYIAPEKITEIYVGFWWKVNPEFNGNIVNASKIFFIRGSIPGTNGVFLMRTNPGEAPYLYWTTQLPNNRDQCGSGPDVDICYPNVQSVPLTRGQWVRVETYFKASSCDTCHDGIVKWWINGTLSGEYNNFAYGPVVDTFVWAQTWDGYGNGMGFQADAHHYLDHLHISCPGGCKTASNTGGGGSVKPPPVPEAQGCPPIPDMKIRTPQNSTPAINLGTPCKNGYEIFGLPPICSLSKGTYDAGRDTWDLTSGDASGLTLNCPNFCGKMEFTIIPKNDP